MARSIADIKALIVAKKESEPGLSGLTSTSQTAIWNLKTFVVAAAIHFHEALWDVFKEELETIARRAVPGTAAWLQEKVLQFQYGSVIQLVDFYPVYLEDHPDQRINTRVSVKQTEAGPVVIKVAKGTETLEPLNASELGALKDYVNTIKFSGTRTQVISLNPDRLMVDAEVFYRGQYVMETVKENVIQAVKDFLKNLPFNGVLDKNKFEDAIQAVPGVDSVVLNQVKGRPAQVPLSSALPAIRRNYETAAGYIIVEDTDSFKPEDTIIMTLA